MSPPSQNLPEALAPLTAETRWVVWRWEKNGKGELTKPPYRLDAPSRKASSTNNTTWGDYEAARLVVERGEADGIGFVLTDSETAAFDLDDCRDPETGEVDDWALKLIDRGASYTEVTPSGTGLRIIGRGIGNKVHRKFKIPDTPGSLEVYRRAERYITITGNVFPGCWPNVANLDEEIDELVAELDPPIGAKPNGSAELQPQSNGHDHDHNAEELLARCGAALQKLIRTEAGPLEDRSAVAFSVLLQLIGKGFSDAEIEKLVMAHPIGRRYADGKDLAADIRRARAKSDGKPREERKAKQPPCIASAADLRRKLFPDLKYFVPGLIAEGCTLLAGRPKLGKSWLMLDIGLAVAAGRLCLGETQCEQGDVLYLALEDNERRLQRRIEKVLGAFGVEWPEAFEYAIEWLRANEGGIEAIRNWVTAAKNPRLVVVDVLMMFRPARGRNDHQYEADYNAIKGLQTLAGEFNIAIVIVHHTRKSGSDVDPFEKVSGTLGLSGAADAALILDRDGNGATLYGRGRDVEEVEVAVEFDKATCRWIILGSAAEVRRTDERSLILTAPRESKEPMSPTEIADATLMSNQNVRQLLIKMVKVGEVRKLGRARYQHPDHNPPPDHNDHKITNLDDYRHARDGGDDE